ncbi:SpoIIE-like protein phosphatase domain protein [Leptospira inadai serovar Lyme str. 10]|uniref:SpoIIE-like protein phosphatase domain protein n=2 Tax=Leptospira inadai serovar Lyme TaxID=293084 RepID=V6HED9_9LEPT|nr:SpoIIE family protein phosphatase [Leptospira inadai]EQA37683.1 SpoIIE-like protein phosphatase domain protein [Leptospira inadai serovar Lyme str. 10]PNV76254.1 serine/threonine protein phosphatase [Leptospira inadai serovar Lyme]
MTQIKKQETLLRSRPDGSLSLEEGEGVSAIFDSFLRESMSLTHAEAGAIFSKISHGELRLVSGESTKELVEAGDWAFSTAGKDLLLERGKTPPWTKHRSNSPIIICKLKIDETGSSLPKGAVYAVLVLRGKQTADRFAKTDFELLRTTCRTIGRLLKESYVSGDSSLVTLSLLATTQLVLEAAQAKRQSERFDFLLTEVIRVSGLINSSLDLSQLLEAIMLSSKTVFRTEACSVLLLDETKEYLYFHTVLGEKSEAVTKMKVPVGKGIAGMVVRESKPMIINDAQNDDRVYKEVDRASQFTTRNIMAAPLVANDEVIGVIEAINTVDRESFNSEDLELFLSFSGTSALAIQKTGLLQNLELANRDLRKKVSELESLFELSHAVTQSRNRLGLVRKTIRLVNRELDASISGIFLYSLTKDGHINCAYFDGKSERIDRIPETTIEGSQIHSSIKEGLPILKRDILDHPFPHALDRTYLRGSYIIVPLFLSSGEPYGALTVADRRDKLSYRDSDFKLLQTMASQVTKGFEAFRLRNEMLAKKAIQQEIDITRKIQQNILPSEKVFLSNFDLGILSVPAKDVSGDFYDYYQYSDGQYSFLVADVSGKSLPAALFMAMSSSIIRTLARNHDLTPEEILRQGNELIFEDSHFGMFVTAFFIHYNPSIFTVEYASAGHNDQVWIKEDGSYELIKGQGPPLGVIPTAKYRGGNFRVKPGDIVVLYTDGAVEEKDAQGFEFGLERMIEEIRSRRHLSSQKIVEELYEEIRKFSGSKEPFDDFTVLVLKFNDDYQFYRTFDANTAQIPVFREFIYDTIKVRNLDEAFRDDILLACDEAGTNIVMHGYKDTFLRNPKFDCKIRFTEDSITIVLTDSGTGFDRTRVKDPSIEENLSGKRKGGFGVYLIEKLMDSVDYRIEEGRNILTLRKNFR